MKTIVMARRWWLDRSIFTKSLCLQSILILVPMVICLLLFFNRLYVESVLTTAENSYQYSRYAVDTLETQIRQVNAATNVVLMNGNVFKLLTTNEESEKTDALLKDILSLLNYTAVTRNPIEKITLFSLESSGSVARKAFPLWTGNTPKSYTGGRWVFQSDGNGNHRSLSLLYALIQNSQHVGILQVDIFEQALYRTVDSVASILGGQCMAYQSDGTLLYTAGSESNAPDIPRDVLSYAEGYHMLTDRRVMCVVNCNTIGITLLATKTFTPGYDFNQKQIHYFAITLGVYVLAAALAIWLQHISVTKRIKCLSSKIEAVNSIDELRPVIDVEGADEIGVLTRNYNNMLLRIAELAHNAQTAQMLHQIAKYSALQAQIQPHFLYNTLETLRMMADENDDAEVADMLFTFGKLLRNSISGKEQDTTLKRELENLDNYLKLNKLRISRLRYEIVCETDISDIVCPRFILQPLVENSIHHGLQNMRLPGHIHVRAYESESYVYVDISDNGIGMSEEQLTKLRNLLQSGEMISQTQGGIGLSNVNARLITYFGDDCGLEINSEPGISTICRVKMRPKQKE